MRAILLIVIIALGTFWFVLNNVSQQYWKAVGPKWDCAFNPDYSEFCKKEE